MKRFVALRLLVFLCLLTSWVFSSDSKTSEFVFAASETAQASQPTPKDKWWQQPRMTGNWGGERDELSARGLDLSFYYNSFVGIRATGGAEPGSTTKYSGSIDFFLQADSQKMGLWQGGQLLMQVKSNQGKNINPSVGAISDPIDDADFTKWIYIDQLWYQHSFLNRKLQVRAGYLDLQTIIDRNAFANSEDVQFMSTLLDNNNAIVPLLIGFGAAVFVDPADWLSFTFGISDRDNTILQAGWDTAFDDFESLMAYGEGTLKSQFPSPRGNLAGNYRFGILHDPREKAIFGTGGEESDPDISPGDVGFYMSFDQMLFPEEPNSQQGLGAFFRWGHRDETVNKLKEVWSAGFQYRGAFPKRDKDLLGFGFYSVLGSDKYKQHSDPEFDRETGYEVYYSFQLTPWLTFSPDFQFIDSPGARESAKDAVVFAFRTRFTL